MLRVDLVAPLAPIAAMLLVSGGHFAKQVMDKRRRRYG